MKTCFFTVLLFLSCLSAFAQKKSLRDSLFGGRLKADTGKTFVSTDTGKYVAPKVYDATNATIPSQGAASKKVEIAKPDESMPDSLNKNFYARQKAWKRFIDINTPIISAQADDTRKVRKGEYTVDIEYEIGLNGRVTTTGVTCTPQNDYLLEQVTELMKRAPVLSPPIYGDGKPRKLAAKQTMTIIKK